MSESHPERRPYDPPMSPDQNYVEINAYVVGWGLFFAALFSLAVGYLCLKIGQTVDAFAPVSVLAMGMAVLFKRKNAFPETVHIQAIASAGTNIIGGVMFILPALFILQLNSQLTYTEMVIPIVLGGGTSSWRRRSAATSVKKWMRLTPSRPAGPLPKFSAATAVPRPMSWSSAVSWPWPMTSSSTPWAGGRKYCRR